MDKVSVKLRAAMARKNDRAGRDRENLQVDQLVCALRFSGIARHQLCDPAYGSAYLKVHRAPGVLRQPAEQSADGFLFAGHARQGCTRHGVRMLPVCARESEWRCTVVSDEAVRLGFCVVNGLRRGACGRAREGTRGTAV